MNAAKISSVDEQQPDLEFDDFFRTEYPRLAGMLYLLTNNAAEAEDVAQEALVRVYERWGRVKEMDSPGGYACRVALNLNHRRLRRLHLASQRLLLRGGPDDPSQDPTTGSELMIGLASLPRNQREALVLTEWLGFGAAEAGTILGIEPPSVRSRVHRGKASLRDWLGKTDE